MSGAIEKTEETVMLILLLGILGILIVAVMRFRNVTTPNVGPLWESIKSIFADSTPDNPGWGSLFHHLIFGEESHAIPPQTKKELDAVAAKLISNDPDTYGGETPDSLEGKMGNAIAQFQSAVKDAPGAVAEWVKNNRVF